MSKFLSGRVRNLKVGISSYTDNSTVVEVIGRVGIGTTFAQKDLYVSGDAEVTGTLEGNDINISGVSTATSYYGDGSTLDNILSNEIRVAQDSNARFIGFLTATSGISTGFATDESIVFDPDTKNLGLGVTNPDARLTIDGNVKLAGFVTATEYYGSTVFGNPSGGFLPGAVEIEENDYTKDSVNEINFILGKLVPKPPTTIAGVPFSLTGLTGVGRLCSGFVPINNTDGELAPTAGTQYSRNVSSNVTSNYITEYGPGDAGSVIGFINNTGVGTAAMTSANNNGTYGALQIANNKDAFFSTRNTGIASEFYQVYDARLINAPSPTGFNKAYIVQGAAQTLRAFWYRDPSTVTAPILTASTPQTPLSPVLLFSSGVPHYTQAAQNAFVGIITCENATGDMYTQDTFLASSGQTSGFQNGGNKNYIDFAAGVSPPIRNYGVGTGVTCLVSQIPRDLHITVSTDITKFSNYTATTPYGTGSIRPIVSQAINIMGTTPRTDQIDEDNILISSLGTGSGNATRVNAGSTGDNPSPVFTSWVASSEVATYESVVRGAVLRHDQINYSIGYLPVGPNYSVGRSGAQYFQLQIIRSQVSQFRISVTGTYAGCWVCMPNNSAWTTSLSGTNGWANMFQAYRGAGIPTSAEPGCSSGAAMTCSSGTFTCVFGTESSSNDSNNRILIRWRLNSGQSITAMSFLNT